MITLRSVTLQRGAKRLLENVNLTVFAPQKIGIVGANGSGKSSLIALLLGELHAEAGDVDMQPGLVIAQVAQETPAVSVPALEYTLDGDRELREIESAIAAVEHDVDHTQAAGQLAELHERLNAIGGYSAPARAA